MSSASTAIGTSVWTRLRSTESNVASYCPASTRSIDRAVDNGEGANDPEDASTGFLSAPGTTCPPISVLDHADRVRATSRTHDGI